MEVIIRENYEEISKYAASVIADQIRRKPDSVIGLATGSTPLGTYKELINLYKNGEIDFSKVTSFNLDEYVNLQPDHSQSYYYFMKKNLFDHINIKPENYFLPDGMAKDIPQSCSEYEKNIKEHGGIDIQILGIGSNGHIAFNEPGSSLGSRTRIKTLNESTIKDNSRFFENIDEVPRYAITMGIGTIMESHAIILLASGENKAEAIAKTIEGPITAMVPATIVQLHQKATIVIEKETASKLKGKYSSEPAKLELN
ncbi:glucosamine-6-phosphate deaminase [candidate division KSB1 bacterium]